jgi:hypothetical protein
MPVILATWEAEIGNMMVPGQLGPKKSFLDPHINRKEARHIGEHLLS